MILASHGIIGSSIVQFVPLLDTYPNAAAAYSLRLLRTAYTGSAIKVRRSSDNTESDIGFASNVLDTSALTTFCGSGDGFVTTWYDQSGNGRNATQTGNALAQPQIVSSGSVLLQGANPTVKFDGVNDNLKSASFTSISQPLTLFLVSKWNAINSFPYLVDLGNDRALGYMTGAGLKNEMSFGGLLQSTVSINTTTFLGWYALANGSGSQLSINNETVITGNGGTGAATLVTLGAYVNLLYDTFSAANYSEFIFYPSNQSTNRTAISTNINDFYTIY